MVRNIVKDWQKDPDHVTENLEENDEGSEEGLKPLVEKEMVERCLYNCDEPSYFFKGAVISSFLCIPFWIILYFLIT
jgi:hypothetical protein